MTIAIMQPYIFPYIGYWQLVKAVDTFVFYDDVHFITRGWINRNKILVNGQEKLITIPCIKASQNKLINEVHFDRNEKAYKNFIKTIEQAYKKAPYFKQVYPLVESIFNIATDNISVLAQNSITAVSGYIGLDTKFKISAESFFESKDMAKADRLIAICQKEQAKHYVNAIGGKELYDKEYFKNAGIQLDFIKSLPVSYTQFEKEFVPNLSIIDVLMFNSKKEITNLLNHSELI